MMLKKQTVWLLTMLSLVIVLSVYYLTLETDKNDMANLNKDQEAAQNESDQDAKKEDEGGKTTITQVTKDEAFEAIRMQLRDERSRQLEELEAAVGTTELSEEERSQAKDEMQRIHEMADKEQLLEKLIMSTLGYEDALVRVDGDEVSITVKGQEPSKPKANEIIQMVKQELGSTFVTVAFQSENETK